MKITPKPGDYVSTIDLSYEQYVKVVEIFVANGAVPNSHPIKHFNSVQYFGWTYQGSLSGCNHRELYAATPRLLSLSDLLGEDPVAWDGEGLPSVGCECEFTYVKSIHGGWLRCKVDFIGRGAVVITTENDSEVCVFKDELKFRPIKSEREIAIVDLYNIIAAHPGVGNSATALYDAGYRKLVK